ncbi:MAG: hypothetical protein RLZZ58_2292 [Pseudomonadota bacterium]|jgi:hypothetical protein
MRLTLAVLLMLAEPAAASPPGVAVPSRPVPSRPVRARAVVLDPAVMGDDIAPDRRAVRHIRRIACPPTRPSCVQIIRDME